MAAKVDGDKCVGCEACIGTCPVEAIAMADAYLAEQGKTNSKITVIPDGIAVIVNPAE